MTNDELTLEEIRAARKSAQAFYAAGAPDMTEIYCKTGEP